MLSATARRHQTEAERPAGFYESNPELLKLRATALTLRTKESELIFEATRIRGETPGAVLHATDSAGGMPTFERAPKQVSSGARQFLADLAPAEIPHDPKTLRWSSPQAKRLNELHAELTAVREALEEIDRQMPAADARASRLYCGQRHGEYETAVRRMCEALVDLAEAVQAHDAVIDDIRTQGANPSFLPLVLTDQVNRAITETNLFERAADVGYGQYSLPAQPTPAPRVNPLAHDIARYEAAELARASYKPPRRQFHGYKGVQFFELPTIEQARRDG